jgi:hypothetical protein
MRASLRGSVSVRYDFGGSRVGSQGASSEFTCVMLSNSDIPVREHIVGLSITLRSEWFEASLEKPGTVHGVILPWPRAEQPERQSARL